MNLRFHAIRLGIKLEKEFLNTIAMTGFGTFHLVNNQNKLEESLISSIKGGPVLYSKITSIKAYDQDGFKIENVLMNSS